MSNLSRIAAEACDEEECNFESKAFGSNKLSRWSLFSGRTLLDGIFYARQTYKFRSYSLDFVAKQLIPADNPLRQKLRIYVPGWMQFTIDKIMTIMEGNVNTEGIRALLHEYRTQFPEAGESAPTRVLRERTARLMANLKQYQSEITGAIRKCLNLMVNIVGVTPQSNYYRMFALYNQNAEGRYIVAKYCMVDSTLALELLFKMNGVLFYDSIARVSGVPTDILTLAGQQVPIYSMIVSTLREGGGYLNGDRILVDVPYEGGLVLQALVSGLVRDTIATLDFWSLYPSIIIHYNLCYATWIPRSHANYASLPGEEVTIEGRTWKFLPKSTVQGWIPRILTKLLALRNQFKDQMKLAVEKSIEYMVYNALQLAVKRQTNATYGFTGVTVKMAMLPHKPMATTVTHYARKLLRQVATFVHDTYPGSKVVYGDTDSVMVKFGDNLPLETVKRLAMDAETKINALFADGVLHIELEKIAIRSVFNPKKKKRYAMLLTTGFLLVKGFEVVRRDSTPLVNDVMESIFKKVMEDDNPTGAEAMVAQVLRDLGDGKVPLEDLQLGFQLKRMEQYANQNLAQVQVVKRMQQRQDLCIPQPGDRLAYVVVQRPNKCKSIANQAESLDYVIANPLKVTPDLEYYLNNHFKKVRELMELLKLKFPNKVFDEVLGKIMRKRMGVRQIQGLVRRRKRNGQPRRKRLRLSNE